MIKIIKEGKKEFITTCSTCRCKFSYELNDISFNSVICPFCKHCVAHPVQFTHISINTSPQTTDYMTLPYIIKGSGYNFELNQQDTINITTTKTNNENN